MKAANLSNISGALILCLLSLVSCIREDNSSCPSEIYRLQFEFSYDGTRALQEGELSVADVYVFDGNDLFVARQQIANPVIGDVYTADFELKAGNYSFVVWVNRTDPYFTVPGPGDPGMAFLARGEAEMRLNVPADRCVRTTIPTQLYGSLAFESTPGKKGRILNIPLTENTNRINLTVRGLAKTAHVYTYTITDDNGNYTFDNAFAPCGEIRYTATTGFGDSDELKSSLTVLRLAEGRYPKLTFRDSTTGEMIYPYRPGQTDNLIEMILKAYANAPRVDFDRTHVYDIVISFETDMSVSVTVNGWKLTLDEQEL